MELNEGLEKLGAREIVDGEEWEGEVFIGSAIEDIRLPSTLKIIGAETFSRCKGLKRVEISDGVEHIGEKCFWDSGVGEIKLPQALKSLEAGTFRSCKNLKSVEIPSGVESIGKECFYCSGIEEIALPGALKEVSEDAF